MARRQKEGRMAFSFRTYIIVRFFSCVKHSERDPYMLGALVMVKPERAGRRQTPLGNGLTFGTFHISLLVFSSLKFNVSISTQNIERLEFEGRTYMVVRFVISKTTSGSGPSAPFDTLAP